MKSGLTIRNASPSELNIITDLAEKIWWPTYSDYLSEEQISFMLTDQYAPQALLMEMNRGIHYSIAELHLKPVGFLAFGLQEMDSTVCRIAKIYILPEVQGLGLGSQLINHVNAFAKEQEACFMELNVNRNNPALSFYLKNGFSILREINIPYYHFVLNDYVMRKRVS